MSGERILVIDDSPTILKVVQLVLTKAGFNVATEPDGEAGLANAKAHKPNMILLDFVMPKMNGYQLCRALAGDETLKDIPVVLMSAKGDQVGDRFVKVMGIVDYITKPFSPEAITAVIQHTIAKYSQKQVREQERPIVQGAFDLAPDPEAQRQREIERGELLERAREAIIIAAAKRDGAHEESWAILRSALDDATLTSILRTVHPATLGDMADDPVLEGDLRMVPIAEVLELLQEQRHSGALQVSRAKGRVDVFFKQGKIDLATAIGVSEEFLLGRFILDSRLMTKQALDAFLQSRTPGSKLLGSQLVKLGYLGEADLKQAISRQTSELIYEILRWNFGHFAFRSTRDLPAIVLDAALALDVSGILMEGFRRVDEWHVIEREIDNFDLVFLRIEDAVAQAAKGRLTRDEMNILELVNGKNSVKDIVRQSRMGSFEVSKMLYRLLSTKLIRRRVMPIAV